MIAFYHLIPNEISLYVTILAVKKFFFGDVIGQTFRSLVSLVVEERCGCKSVLWPSIRRLILYAVD